MTRNAKGIIALFSAYLMWGAMPIYWKAIEAVSSFEILGHRVIWSVVFTLVLITLKRNWQVIGKMLRSRKKDVLWLAAGGFLISFNWGLYIWAVNGGRILETSLGYFINPLLSMFLGMIFFKEKLNRIQTLALVLAVLGVSIELVAAGSLPLVSLGLAISFGLYGVLKKTVAVEPEIALFTETVTVAPFALAWLIFLQKEGLSSFPYDSMTNLMLAGAGIMTSIPLLMFAYGASRVPLTTVGFVQFVTPTLSFAIGLLIFKEDINMNRVFTFMFIWAALILYTTDLVFSGRKSPRKNNV
ncbi:MAG: EamA family transporter RarD [Synergistaceae bacterium]|nr:EamA family transporter RarD [Synergistaceae bacterium]